MRFLANAFLCAKCQLRRVALLRTQRFSTQCMDGRSRPWHGIYGTSALSTLRDATELTRGARASPRVGSAGKIGKVQKGDGGVVKRDVKSQQKARSFLDACALKSLNYGHPRARNPQASTTASAILGGCGRAQDAVRSRSRAAARIWEKATQHRPQPRGAPPA